MTTRFTTHVVVLPAMCDGKLGYTLLVQCATCAGWVHPRCYPDRMGRDITTMSDAELDLWCGGFDFSCCAVADDGGAAADMEVDAEAAATTIADPTALRDLAEMSAVKSLSRSRVEALVRAMGGRVSTTRNTNNNTVHRWISTPSVEREFLFLSVNELRDRIGPSARTSWNRQKCLDVLTGAAPVAPRRDDTFEDIVVSTGFMKGLTGRAKKSATQGHTSERPLLRRLQCDSDRGLTSPDTVEKVESTPKPSCP